MCLSLAYVRDSCHGIDNFAEEKRESYQSIVIQRWINFLFQLFQLLLCLCVMCECNV